MRGGDDGKKELCDVNGSMTGHGGNRDGFTISARMDGTEYLFPFPIIDEVKHFFSPISLRCRAACGFIFTFFCGDFSVSFCSE